MDSYFIMKFVIDTNDHENYTITAHAYLRTENPGDLLVIAILCGGAGRVRLYTRKTKWLSILLEYYILDVYCAQRYQFSRDLNLQPLQIMFQES